LPRLCGWQTVASKQRLYGIAVSNVGWVASKEAGEETACVYYAALRKNRRIPKS
jgi:hypothetical protein